MALNYNFLSRSCRRASRRNAARRAVKSTALATPLFLSPREEFCWLNVRLERMRLEKAVEHIAAGRVRPRNASAQCFASDDLPVAWNLSRASSEFMPISATSGLNAADGKTRASKALVLSRGCRATRESYAAYGRPGKSSQEVA